MTAPARIVSLVPSLTELVWWFGLGARLAGRTRFCIEPAGAIDAVPIVGGTKNPHIERITALAPDLVIANREENRREDVEALQGAGLDVLVTDPNTVAEALDMILDLGRLLDATPAAVTLVEECRAELAQTADGPRTRVFVPIWHKPLMGLGSQSYGHDLLERAGAHNVLGDRPRYPEVTMDEVAALHPDLTLLPDEPYPFGERDVAAFAPLGDVRLIDGKLLWWYGPRIPEALRALRTLMEEVPA
jgi:ABC-type Fe3+-hydroxamate transport system substrate-binding protein